MKKLFIILSILFVFLISPINANAYYGYEYGGYLELTDFELQEYYQYTSIYDTNGTSTYIFKYITNDITLHEFTVNLGESVSNFMVLWNQNTGYNYKYYNNPNTIPTENIAWSIDDGVLCIIVKQNYIIGDPDLMIEYIVNNIKIETWIIYNPNQNYVSGYNDGYEDGFEDGFEGGLAIGYDDGYSVGWDAGEEYGYSDGYDDGKIDGYSDGHTAGYNDGLSEGTSVWGVLFNSMLSTFGTVLSIEIFPDLTIGMLAAVPLILGLLSFIIGVAKGGKRND